MGKETTFTTKYPQKEEQERNSPCNNSCWMGLSNPPLPCGILGQSREPLSHEWFDKHECTLHTPWNRRCHPLCPFPLRFALNYRYLLINHPRTSRLFSSNFPLKRSPKSAKTLLYIKTSHTIIPHLLGMISTCRSQYIFGFNTPCNHHDRS